MEIIETPEGRFYRLPKLDGEGRALYLLPRPDLEIEYTISRTIKTTEVTDRPVMITAQVPLLDGEGVQQEYEVTRPVYEQIPITDEDDNVIGYRDGDVTGQEGTGQYLKLWTTEEQQETDGEGAALYWATIEEPATRYEPQPPLEITADDPSYVEGLEPAYDLVPVPPEQPIPQPPTPEERIAELDNRVTTTEDAILVLMDMI